MKHCTVDLGGPVHYVDHGGTGKPIVLVHGLGGSHVNWAAVGPALTAHGRVVALDLAGHGRTRSVNRNARVTGNRQLLGAFLRTVAGEPAVLIGNSMGGYLSMAAAADEPDRVSSLVLVDPACPVKEGVKWDRRVFYLFMGYALPGIGGLLLRRRRRLPAERMVEEMLALCCVDASRVPPAVVAAHVDMARERQGLGRAYGRDFLDAQRSLMAQLLRRDGYFRMVASVRAPALIVQGDRDRLVNVESARALAALRPDWRLEILEGVGHVPQLEVPERFLKVVEPWLAERAAA
jgi:pimeloyl-ACP methyl ester carboxylesterase